MCELHFHDAATADHPVGVTEFVDELVVAVTSCRVYWPDHPRVKTSILALVTGLRTILDESKAKRLEIGATDGYLFVNQEPLLGASLSALRIIQALSELDSGGLAFGAGSSETDFVPLIELLGQRKVDRDFKEANTRLRSAGCASVELLPPYQTKASANPGAASGTAAAIMGSPSGGSTQRVSINVPVRLYQDVVDLLQDSMVKICRGECFDIDRTKGFVESILNGLTDDIEPMMSASRYEQYDAFTFGHSIRVCFLSLNFAKSLTRDETLLHRIGLSALLHDIGKAWVPFDVLHSTGRLSHEERLEMNKHTLYGGEIILEMGDSDPMAVTTAYGHHQTSDHKGYPDSLHHARLSTATKIVKICDVYEALTSVRPYKARMSPTRAYRIMLSMGDHFDRALLRRFITINGIYPIGSLVRLSTGETARVLSQTHSNESPVVVVESTSDNDPLASDDQFRLDLSRRDLARPMKIEELLVDNEI